MLAIFLVWLFKAVVDARTRRSANMEVQGEYRMSRVAIYSVVGLALLVVAGHLIVTAARAIAISFGIDEFVIGATIVAVGTSVPELATTLIAKLRGHDEVGLGTVLGSNIFNGAFIVAVAASIHPVVMPFQHVAVVLVFGIATIVLVYPPRNGVISRWRGLLLLVLYGAYVSAILRSGVV
jgi:cation:H+ antiporter